MFKELKKSQSGFKLPLIICPQAF